MSEKIPARLLVGKKDITNYLQVGVGTFYELIKIGLPARVINGRYYAHADCLDDFLKKYLYYDNRKTGIVEEPD